jgi:RNA polymerase sigma factor (sigma-70 family)
MDRVAPRELTALLEARSAASVDEAWDALLRRYSRLIMHAVRRADSGYDGTMDRYAHVLEMLRSDDFRRLRTFEPGQGARFSTWLVVVSQRLSVDLHRRRFGRTKVGGNPDGGHDVVRRRLAELIAESIDLMELPDASAPDPQAALIVAERKEAVIRAVKALPNRDRLLLALRFIDDVSAPRIAAAMGFPTPFHVYRRIDKVLGLLRSSLGGEDFRRAYG